MAKHEFGIMDIAPNLEQEYNDYEPDKYHCVSVIDEDIVPFLKEFSTIPCYWSSLKQEKRGLAYCGITIIPPNSLEKFISIIDGKTQFNELKNMLNKANKANKYVIHFGIWNFKFTENNEVEFRRKTNLYWFLFFERV